MSTCEHQLKPLLFSKQSHWDENFSFLSLFVQFLNVLWEQTLIWVRLSSSLLPPCLITFLKWLHVGSITCMWAFLIFYEPVMLKSSTGELRRSSSCHVFWTSNLKRSTLQPLTSKTFRAEAENTTPPQIIKKLYEQKVIKNRGEGRKESNKRSGRNKADIWEEKWV